MNNKKKLNQSEHDGMNKGNTENKEKMREMIAIINRRLLPNECRQLSDDEIAKILIKEL